VQLVSFVKNLAMWCATGKFSIFENFATDSKMFENFIAYLNFFFKKSHRFKKFGTKLTHSAPYMYTHSALGGALWVNLKFQKKIEFCSRLTYP
jgi:hypothetical protein